MFGRSDIYTEEEISDIAKQKTNNLNTNVDDDVSASSSASERKVTNAKVQRLTKENVPSVHGRPNAKLKELQSRNEDDLRSRQIVTPAYMQPARLPNEEGTDFHNTLNNAIETNSIEKTSLDKSRSLFTKPEHNLPHFLSSDALRQETELELKRLTALSSFQNNHSIYKLAYDENLTDQSDSRPSSPEENTPESQVPCSIDRSEILIHEADSNSDAGSEDVELLPHRYESETSCNENNRHVYINKLSLAVELLRTHETLPYDEEFKRVETQNALSKANVCTTKGETNFAFIDDGHQSVTRQPISLSGCGGVNRPMQDITGIELQRHSAMSAADSGVQSEDSEEESRQGACEKRETTTARDIKIGTDEVNASYRRFGIQAQQSLNFMSSRSPLMNPCFCCIIM